MITAILDNVTTIHLPLLLALLIAVYLVILIQKYLFPILQYTFFARFQILIALLLVALPRITRGAEPLLGNLLILETGYQLFVVTLFSVILAWVVMITVLVFWMNRERLIADKAAAYAAARPAWLHRLVGDLVERLGRFFASSRFAPIIGAAGFALLMLPLVIDVYQKSVDIPVTARILAVTGALFLAATLYTGSYKFIRADGRFAALHAAVAGTQRVVTTVWMRLLRGLFFGNIPTAVTQGFGSSNRSGATHTTAFVLAAVSLFFYVLGFFFLRPGSGSSLLQNAASALAYLLFLLILAGWALPLASFFLDRFRVPVSFVLIVVSLTSSFLVPSDYYYELHTDHDAVGADTAKLGPAELLALWEAQQPYAHTPLVIVTASGGGIAAAAWTTQVLTGLQERMQELGEEQGMENLGEAFARSIFLISSASGGSVGAMYYAHAFADGIPPTSDAALRRIQEQAEASSLVETAWGILYADALQMFFPPLFKLTRGRNRGWSMAESWANRLKSTPDAADVTLGQWRRELLDGQWRPVTVFGSTVVETGGLMALTPADPPGGRIGTQYFVDTYGDYTINVATAARVSAAFPYVSPMSRPMYDGEINVNEKLEKISYHLGDGGYHDNYGTLTALEWIRYLLKEHREKLTRDILIVEIRLSSAAPLAGEAGGNHTWLYSVAGPALAFYNVWFSTQVIRGQFEIELLQDLNHQAQAHGANPADLRPAGERAQQQQTIQLARVVFQPYIFHEETSCYVDVAGLPLSWQLSSHQKTALRNAWHACPPNNVTGAKSVYTLFAKE